jgi:tRNA(Ile)-lysidine synthase
VERRAPDSANDTSERAWALIAPGAIEAPELGWRVRAAVIETPPGLEGAALPEPPQLPPLAQAGTAAAIHRGEYRVYTDADVTGAQLTVRSWRPGDRFRPLGMARAKKLQDVFADAKIPRDLRRRLPLVCVGVGAEERIVWVVGVRIGDEFKLTPATRRALALQAEPLNSEAGDTHA